MRESMALRQSRAGAAGRFGVFNPMDTRDDKYEYEDSDHEAMQSSWIPPTGTESHGQKTSQVQSPSAPTASSEVLSDVDSRDHDHLPGIPEGGYEHDIEEHGSHMEAPDDIMFGVSLEDSIPPRSLVSSCDGVRSDYDNRSATGGQESIDLSTTGQKVTALPSPISQHEVALVYHDRYYSLAYMMCQASLFATSLFIYLRTDTPATPMIDSIYAVLVRSTGLILWDTLVAFGIAAVWLIAMRSFVKSLIYLVIVAVPTLFIAFSFYVLVWSYKGTFGGYELQARAMRWSSLMTAIFALLWVYTAYARRHAMSQAVQIVRLACTILEHNLHLITLSLANLVVFIVYSFIWLQQFERIFLRGAFTGAEGARRWLLDRDSWMLGAYFILAYLWTLGISSGIQRAATSAIVSQWYFHRHTQPSTPHREIVLAGLGHGLSTSFGSVCAASLFALLTRLPLLALPRRMSGMISLVVYMLFSAPILSLTQPLTLSYASIHSIPLSIAAKCSLDYPSKVSGEQRRAYRTAKMLLNAARATAALGLGTMAWVSCARSGNGGGSLYAYIVGLAAGTIGWAIVGATEGMVSIIVDASLVCYNIDINNSREGRSHCLDAVAAFSNRGRTNGALHV